MSRSARTLIPALISASALALAASGAAANDHLTIVHAGQLLAVPGEEVQTEKSVLIRNGRVDRVLDGYITAADIPATEDVSISMHDLSDHFVMPGLIDGHVHILGELGPRGKLNHVEMSDPDVAFEGARYARISLMAGFTTVRDTGAQGGDAVFALRDAINRGDLAGSRVFAAGSTVSPTGGHGQRHGYRREIINAMMSPGVCDGPAECRRAVRTQVNRGADHIKFVATGGVLSETAAGTGQQFFKDEMEAIVETAHSMGRKVTAHAHGKDGIEAALRAGVDSIEHGTYGDAETFRLYRRTGAYLVPTIHAGITVTELATPEDSFMPPAIRAKSLLVGPNMLDMVRRAHEAGVKIAFGTDCGVGKHGTNAREFGFMVEAGMTPEETIIAATVNVADNMGQSENLGTLEPGKWGDLIAVDGNPLEDVDVLLDVDFVMKEGVAYKNL